MNSDTNLTQNRIENKVWWRIREEIRVLGIKLEESQPTLSQITRQKYLEKQKTSLHFLNNHLSP